MSDHSAIEWTDATWNPVTGCTRVSPGCAHCYIERTPPFRLEGRRFERVGAEETTGVRLHPKRLEQPLRWRKPRRVFVCSLADLFHDDVPDDYIRGVFWTMQRAEHHVFQVLTKRPERMAAFVADYSDRHLLWTDEPEPQLAGLPNVWLGVSIENARHTWRADVLREIPAAVRFISAEPLLGSLYDAKPCRECAGSGSDQYQTSSDCSVCGGCGNRSLDLTGIDWLIAGGESGPGARPMYPDWARELLDACLSMRMQGAFEMHRRAGHTAFFFKQWGGKTPKSGGRLLDGRTWDEMPTVRT